jgi:hypothetical protein
VGFFLPGQSRWCEHGAPYIDKFDRTSPLPWPVREIWAPASVLLKIIFPSRFCNIDLGKYDFLRKNHISIYAANRLTLD